MLFFPGREHIYSIRANIKKMTTHIYNRTITTQPCREIVTHTQINYKNSHINKNRSSLKVAEVKMSIGTAFHQ